MILFTAALGLAVLQQGKKDTSSSTQSKSSLQIPTPPIMPNLVKNPAISAPVLPASGKDGVTPEVGPLNLTVESAVQTALRLQPSLKSALGQEEAARGALNAARAGLYPSAALTGGWGYVTRLGKLGLGGSPTGGSSAGSSSNGFTSELEIKQLLYDFGKTSSLVRQAAHQAAAAHKMSVQEASDIELSVRQQYYAAIQAEEQVKVDEADVKAQQDGLNLATGLLKEGLGAPADVVTAETSLNSSTAALSAAQAQALVSKVELAALIGLDPTTPLTLAPIPDPITVLPDLSQGLKSALNQRPDVLAAEETVLAAKAGVQVQKTGLSPSLSLGLTASSRGESDPFATDQTGAVLSVTVPIADGGLTRAKTQQAKGQLLQAESSLQTAKLSAVQDVSQAYVALQAAIQKELVANAEVANAQEGLKLAEGQYKAGVGLFLNITNAQALLTSAETSQIASRAEEASAWAQYLHAIGQNTPLPGALESKSPAKAQSKS